MSGAYLEWLLAREDVDRSPTSPALQVRALLTPYLMRWGNGYIETIVPSGSYAKGTANASGTDIDLFISLRRETPNTLREIHDTLFNALERARLRPKRQNVSVNVALSGKSIDLVPGKRQDTNSWDHSLYRRKADTWTKTNTAIHIGVVGQSGLVKEMRLMKLWRDQNGLDWPSFFLELTVIAALAERRFDLPGNVVAVLLYLRDNFVNARVVDPANQNNVISDDLTNAEKLQIRAAAVTALEARQWIEVIR